MLVRLVWCPQCWFGADVADLVPTILVWCPRCWFGWFGARNAGSVHTMLVRLVWCPQCWFGAHDAGLVPMLSACSLETESLIGHAEIDGFWVTVLLSSNLIFFLEVFVVWRNLFNRLFVSVTRLMRTSPWWCVMNWTAGCFLLSFLESCSLCVGVKDNGDVELETCFVLYI